MSDLKSASAEINKEDDVAGFLGVNIARHDDGSIELTQCGLIVRIIESLDLSESNSKDIPASNGTLPNDDNGEECLGTFNYTIILGMLLCFHGYTTRYIIRCQPMYLLCLQATTISWGSYDANRSLLEKNYE